MSEQNDGAGQEPPDRSRPAYRVETADRAEIDLNDAFLRQGRLLGENYAGDWYAKIQRAIADLSAFPGPLSHAIDPEASDLFGVEVRRMLYFGPGRRRSGTPYRVLFTIIAPARAKMKPLSACCACCTVGSHSAAPIRKRMTKTAESRTYDHDDQHPHDQP